MSALQARSLVVLVQYCGERYSLSHTRYDFSTKYLCTTPIRSAAFNVPHRTPAPSMRYMVCTAPHRPVPPRYASATRAAPHRTIHLLHAL